MSEEKTIFLTSGASDVGVATIKKLVNAGYKTYGVVYNRDEAEIIRAVNGIPVFSLPNHAGELRAMIAMSKAKVVVHLAPLAANHPPFSPPSYTPDQITQETVALLEAAKAADVNFFIHGSYTLLYGHTNGETVDESSPLTKASDPLVAAGILAEKAVIKSELPYCILRTGYIYSPNSEAIHKLDRALKSSSAVFTSEGYAGWVYADDVANAVLKAIEKQPEGEIFNIVDDTPATTAEFVQYLCEAQGIEPPGAVSSILKMFSRNPNPTLLGFSAKPSNNKAKAHLEWSPRFKDYRQGIDDLLLEWRAQINVN
ncbi:MAG: hypothetical protein CUN56_02600 [Phototrophicales bacterium]|nr:MAG: hypothetical protein CUN56_02600 [Phototrophicales bacterium]